MSVMAECIRCLSTDLESESMGIPTPIMFGVGKGGTKMSHVGWKVACTSCGERWTVLAEGEIGFILNEYGDVVD